MVVLVLYVTMLKLIKSKLSEDRLAGISLWTFWPILTELQTKTQVNVLEKTHYQFYYLPTTTNTPCRLNLSLLWKASQPKFQATERQKNWATKLEWKKNEKGNKTLRKKMEIDSPKKRVKDKMIWVKNGDPFLKTHADTLRRFSAFPVRYIKCKVATAMGEGIRVLSRLGSVAVFSASCFLFFIPWPCAFRTLFSLC